ncbi:MAG: FAD-binding oxidoreductase [Kordiimonadaceae bacterium]|nr:FAD-binding oxidoreductase [Kordiimonadaceae bacterium]MBO6569621.1 FAD-binding oxidoreductase [Kordiimonadaceae bacterium]MBO6966156.1 FAD-binding oxidoreductase [Kordiimonadaceae bacterium]
MQKLDFLIVGAGIAGAGAAYRLAGHGASMLVDMEEQAGYHTTGRSAAFYAETYGGEKLQPLTTASKEFLHNPPLGFCEAPLITDLGAIHVFDTEQEAEARALFERDKQKLPHIEMLSADELQQAAPQLTGGRFVGAIRDMECGNLDVAALHQGYIKAAKKMGVEVKLEAQFEKADRIPGGWRVKLGREEVEARVIINSAGAWGDQVAERCGIEPLGLEPLRRTLVTIPNPEGLPFDRHLPVILDFDEDFYFKPEGEGYLVSPADETPSAACDSQPDLEDIAIAVDHFERATGSSVTKLEAKWAGLRTFAPDRAPVIGFEPGVDGFFWNVGQGGYGIQTSPAWSRYVAFLLLGKGMPEDLKQAGAKASWYDPARFRD